MSLEIVFHDALGEKKNILQKKKFLEGQKWQFCKGVNPWF